MSILGDLLSLFQAPTVPEESTSLAENRSNNSGGTKKKNTKKKGKKLAANSSRQKAFVSEDSAGDADLDTDVDIVDNPHHQGGSGSGSSRGSRRGRGNMFDASESDLHSEPESPEREADSYIHVSPRDADAQSDADAGTYADADTDAGVDDEEKKVFDIATSQYLTHHMEDPINDVVRAVVEKYFQHHNAPNYVNTIKSKGRHGEGGKHPQTHGEVTAVVRALVSELYDLNMCYDDAELLYVYLCKRISGGGLGYSPVTPGTGVSTVAVDPVAAEAALVVKRAHKAAADVDNASLQMSKEIFAYLSFQTGNVSGEEGDVTCTSISTGIAAHPAALLDLPLTDQFDTLQQRLQHVVTNVLPVTDLLVVLEGLNSWAGACSSPEDVTTWYSTNGTEKLLVAACAYLASKDCDQSVAVQAIAVLMQQLLLLSSHAGSAQNKAAGAADYNSCAAGLVAIVREFCHLSVLLQQYKAAGHETAAVEKLVCQYVGAGIRSLQQQLLPYIYCTKVDTFISAKQGQQRELVKSIADLHAKSTSKNGTAGANAATGTGAAGAPKVDMKSLFLERELKYDLYQANVDTNNTISYAREHYAVLPVTDSRVTPTAQSGSVQCCTQSQLQHLFQLIMSGAETSATPTHGHSHGHHAADGKASKGKAHAKPLTLSAEEKVRLAIQEKKERALAMVRELEAELESLTSGGTPKAAPTAAAPLTAAPLAAETTTAVVPRMAAQLVAKVAEQICGHVAAIGGELSRVLVLVQQVDCDAYRCIDHDQDGSTSGSATSTSTGTGISARKYKVITDSAETASLSQKLRQYVAIECQCIEQLCGRIEHIRGTFAGMQLEIAEYRALGMESMSDHVVTAYQTAVTNIGDDCNILAILQDCLVSTLEKAVTMKHQQENDILAATVPALRKQITTPGSTLLLSDHGFIRNLPLEPLDSMIASLLACTGTSVGVSVCIKPVLLDLARVIHSILPPKAKAKPVADSASRSPLKQLLPAADASSVETTAGASGWADRAKAKTSSKSATQAPPTAAPTAAPVAAPTAAPVAAPTAAPVATSKPGRCFDYFDKGSCRFGDKCRFSHEGVAGSGAGGRSRGGPGVGTRGLRNDVVVMASSVLQNDNLSSSHARKGDPQRPRVAASAPVSSSVDVNNNNGAGLLAAITADAEVSTLTLDQIKRNNGANVPGGAGAEEGSRPRGKKGAVDAATGVYVSSFNAPLQRKHQLSASMERMIANSKSTTAYGVKPVARSPVKPLTNSVWSKPGAVSVGSEGAAASLADIQAEEAAQAQIQIQAQANQSQGHKQKQTKGADNSADAEFPAVGTKA